MLHVVNNAGFSNTSKETAWATINLKDSVHFILFLEQIFMLTQKVLTKV